MVFNDCINLKSVRLENGEHELSVGYGQDGDRPYGLFYNLPIEELFWGRDLAYPSTYSGWKNEAIAIHLDDGEKYYHGYAPFQSCNLKRVMIDDCVTKIRPYTFYNCKQLEYIEIP